MSGQEDTERADDYGSAGDYRFFGYLFDLGSGIDLGVLGVYNMPWPSKRKVADLRFTKGTQGTVYSSDGLPISIPFVGQVIKNLMNT